jgi:antirestriction protein ArdC
MTNKVYQIVTDRVLEIMAQGQIPWRKPWRGTRLTFLNIAGREYSGINRFMLSMAPFETPLFLTYHQAQKLGGTIKKGAASFPIFFYSYVNKKDDNGNEKIFPIFRYSNAFNISDAENVTVPKKVAEMLEKLAEKNINHNPIDDAQKIIDSMPNAPRIVVAQSDAAYYKPSCDTVMLPNLGQYEKAEAYYSTAFHELGHSTGHTSRLNRDTVMDAVKFGSHEYSVEELIAEFTATFLAAEAGIERGTIENSAAYLQSWASHLREKPAMLVQAASKAQKAADYILGKTASEAASEA